MTATHHVNDSTTFDVFHYLCSIASMCSTVSLNHNSRLTRFCFCSVTQQIVDVGTNFSPASTPVFYPHPLRQLSVTVPSPPSVYTLYPTFPYLPSTVPIYGPSKPLFNTQRMDLHCIYTLLSSLSESESYDL